MSPSFLRLWRRERCRRGQDPSLQTTRSRRPATSRPQITRSRSTVGAAYMPPGHVAAGTISNHRRHLFKFAHKCPPITHNPPRLTPNFFEKTPRNPAGIHLNRAISEQQFDKNCAKRAKCGKKYMRFVTPNWQVEQLHHDKF